MTHENDAQGIECTAPAAHKLLRAASWILLGILFALGRDLSNGIFLIFWMGMGLVFLASKPDLILFDEGIEVRMWWLRAFVEWDNVRSAHYRGWKTQLSVKEVAPPSFIMKTLVNTDLSITQQFRNYSFTVDILQERLGKRFFGDTRKKREEYVPLYPPE
ncbi:MAG: hypothetical protein K8I30_16585 [Anaerolineae bacterium]|nr:hypothetical protein [Anaerolineae bacterium]